MASSSLTYLSVLRSNGSSFLITENKKINEHGQIKGSERLNEALEAEQVTSSTVKFTPLKEKLKGRSSLDFQFKEFDKFVELIPLLPILVWPIIVTTDSTKLRELVYSMLQNLTTLLDQLYHIQKQVLKYFEDIHPKINYVLESNVIATQVHKSSPMTVAMIPTKGNEGAEQIAS
ncbi:hypothetical protein GLOIN_2v807055 [Rhizophagus clarus]|uniref:Uncharacterized protein n=1 Tax=Rhizophagus clarus TaxID=94130 RepID=A0A8H3MC12_9GLOM|nr:hypothetical protein GLOIN_2v807055 [Rhizophagus clarus]